MRKIKWIAGKVIIEVPSYFIMKDQRVYDEEGNFVTPVRLKSSDYIPMIVNDEPILAEISKIMELTYPTSKPSGNIDLSSKSLEDFVNWKKDPHFPQEIRIDWLEVPLEFRDDMTILITPFGELNRSSGRPPVFRLFNKRRVIRYNTKEFDRRFAAGEFKKIGIDDQILHGRWAFREFTDIIMARAFVPNPNQYTRLIHKNGELYNDQASNLQWVPDDYKPE